MQNRGKLLIIAISFLLIICLGLIFYLFANKDKTSTQTAINNNESETLVERSNYFGISGFSPVNFPEFSAADFVNYWEDLNSVAQIYGVHTTLENTNLIENASANLSVPISLVISHKDIKNLDKIYSVLESNPKIKYLGIGNEINILRYENLNEYEEFLFEAKEKFPQIKAKYKHLKLFTVFQYETLLGKGFITGKEYEKSISIIKDWDEIIDVVGLTVYPHFDYGKPHDIPQNYFDELMQFTSKNFVITETSWPSNIKAFSGEYERFNTDEIEQADFMDWIRRIRSEYEPEFINWLFLNDIKINNPSFNGAGLRTIEGKQKLSFTLWKDLLAGK